MPVRQRDAAWSAPAFLLMTGGVYAAVVLICLNGIGSLGQYLLPGSDHPQWALAYAAALLAWWLTPMGAIPATGRGGVLLESARMTLVLLGPMIFLFVLAERFAPPVVPLASVVPLLVLLILLCVALHAVSDRAYYPVTTLLFAVGPALGWWLDELVSARTGEACGIYWLRAGSAFYTLSNLAQPGAAPALRASDCMLVMGLIVLICISLGPRKENESIPAAISGS